jgi:hypothetical protein
LELHTLSTWHSNQQVDGSHYEAEATILFYSDCINDCISIEFGLKMYVAGYSTGRFRQRSCFQCFANVDFLLVKSKVQVGLYFFLHMSRMKMVASA